ncbi:MAG: glutaredoxin family protein [Patescibacteria group bacterium]
MQRHLNLLLLVVGFLLIIFSPVLAQQNQVGLYFFYGQGCPHCARAEIFLEQLKKQYAGLDVFPLEVFYNQNNRFIYLAMARAYGLSLTEIQVPVIYIGEKSFVGYNDFIGSQIRNEVLRCLNQKCPSPIEKIQSEQNNQNFDSKRSSKQVMIGWIAIGLIVLAIVFLLIKFIFRKKKI